MTTIPAAHEPGSGPFAGRLPAGESLPVPERSFVTRDLLPLEGEMRVEPLAARTGPMLRRVERAVMPLGGIALPLRDGLLPQVSGEERRRTNGRVAAALAAGGGKAYAR
ncbi:hypothetical protein [Streptomyces sp. Wb2n-11]|uniref:hypothetical protein n=1 Tax=Streptomyces sp. Wb2n-11 TaxID=1030533 RepID=UPI000A3E205B|nr:hypothetical protein [Streptomyces sp. Wb2n-11]